MQPRWVSLVDGQRGLWATGEVAAWGGTWSVAMGVFVRAAIAGTEAVCCRSKLVVWLLKALVVLAMRH